jgi:hypothetical protein
MKLYFLDWVGTVLGISFKVAGRSYGAADKRALD